LIPIFEQFTYPNWVEEIWVIVWNCFFFERYGFVKGGEAARRERP
jgi:hypothetical protein